VTRPRQAAPQFSIARTIPSRDQTNNHGQYIRLGKTVSGDPVASGPSRMITLSCPDAWIVFTPHSAQTQKRLVFLLSSRCQSPGLLNPDNLLSHLSIRQPVTPIRVSLPIWSYRSRFVVFGAWLQKRLGEPVAPKVRNQNSTGSTKIWRSLILVEPIGIEPMTF
jgi:hypothetical protein